MKPIGIPAAFCKATTLVDGGWRISFDCGLDAAAEIAQLAQYQGQLLYVVVMETPVDRPEILPTT